jgi:DNA-binding PadR family transcriptional regulator
MSVTRMLVLGAVRIFQPTHGYFVRRELASWQVADWAHLNPGSVYNALRTLTREGYLAAEDSADDSSGSPKTSYRLTVDGETEFLRLVRLGLWELHPYEPGWLLAGISFWGALTRDEVMAALDARAKLLTARLSGSRYAAMDIGNTMAGTPDHVVELFHLSASHQQGELAWVEAARARIAAGEYGFQGEDPRRLRPAQNPQLPPDSSPN